MSARILASDLGRRLMVPANSTRTAVPARDKGGVLPHKKPRWVPPAPSKLFNLRRVDHTPQEEREQLNALKYNYRAHFNAITQFLYEDYLRNSDTGEAAVIEAKREAEALTNLIAENEGYNERVAARRKERLKRDAEERKRQIEADLEEKSRLEEVRQRQIAEVVASETESMKNRIRKEDIGRAVEEALANPVDYEYAIDTEGHMYRGRYTRPTPETAEKIPQPTEEGPSESMESIVSRYPPTQ